MSRVLLSITLLFTLFVNSSYAEQENICKKCSLLNEHSVTSDSGSFLDTGNPSDSLNPSVDASSKAVHNKQSVMNKNSHQEDILFRSQIDRLDEILRIYTEENGLLANTKKIDILSEFRKGENGQDMLIPLGFFLYLNKKF